MNKQQQKDRINAFLKDLKEKVSDTDYSSSSSEIESLASTEYVTSSSLSDSDEDDNFLNILQARSQNYYRPQATSTPSTSRYGPPVQTPLQTDNDIALMDQWLSNNQNYVNFVSKKSTFESNLFLLRTNFL